MTLSKHVCDFLALLSASLVAGACAGAQPPVERMATAEAAARAAREVGAERVPRAELQVKLADDEIARAHALMNDGDNAAADFMLQRANADAELALALAREDTARGESQRVFDETRGVPKPAPESVAPPAPGEVPPPPPAAAPMREPITPAPISPP